MMLGDLDTIAAIATARGTGALSIVRLSGSGTSAIVGKCFLGKGYNPQASHQATFGIWTNSMTGAAADEVVVLNFSDGRGFTGEPSVEIICHGGTQVTELVLEATLSAGARLARPGEFTYRAVMNGKLDLAKAEGILELISARTPRAAARALDQIRGALSVQLNKIEEDVVYILAHLEAAIDFTTEDIQPVSFKEMRERALCSKAAVDDLLRGYLAGQLINRGLRVVLAGKPNGGKSSLLNKLLGKERSIVAPTPGTTRDTIEDDVLIEGNLFRLVDTAGIRDFESTVEKLGIERTLNEIKVGDVVIYVVDSSIGLSNEDAERVKEIGGAAALVCFNKSDLKQINTKDMMARFGLGDYRFLSSSAHDNEGLTALRHSLMEMTKTATDGEMTSMLSTQRQKEGVASAGSHLEKAIELLERSASPDLVAFEMKESLLQIQAVLGKNVGDDVMDKVFKEFCIGK